MSSLLDNKKQMQESIGNKIGFVVVTLFLIWLFFPNNNNFFKLSYWSNNLFYHFSKIMKTNKTPEYIHYRNNAIYLVKVYPKNPTPAVNEINKAFSTAPEDLSSKDKSKLYKDSALIKFYYGDNPGALADYLKVEKCDSNDNFRIAVLQAEEAKYTKALYSCDKISSYNKNAILGDLCKSYIYEKFGDLKSAEQIYDSLVYEKPSNVLVYMERSHFKKRIGDEQGRLADFEKAKELSSYVRETDASIIDKILDKKELPLSII